MANAQLAGVLRHLRHLVAARRVEELSDGRLLERFVRGRDEAAFAALVQRHSGLVLGVCRRVLQHAQDAEDAFQAAFLVLAQRAGAIRNPEAVGSWLYEVAYHIATRARAHAARRRTSERQAHAKAPPETPAQTAWPELQPILDEELHRLPEKYRRPLVLCYFQGKTNRQAAAELGWPVGSISRRLARARELLRRSLTRRGVVLSGTALASFLAGQRAASASPALVHTTARAALFHAAGKTAAGLASPYAFTLAQGALKSMVLTKLKIATAFLLALGILVLGALTRPAAAQRQAGAPAELRAAPEPPLVKKEVKIPKGAADSSSKEAGKKMTVRGKALYPDGKPAAGADVAVVNNLKVTLRSWESVYPQKMLGRGKADANGKFRLTVARTSSLRSFGLYVWAISKDSDLAVQSLDPDATRHEVTIKLNPPKTARVRLVDLQGQPVAGIKVHTSWNSVSPFLPGPVITDAQGRFTARRWLGTRSVSYFIRDDRFARHGFWVTVDAKEPGKEIVSVLAPAQIFEGKVTYGDSGKAVRNAIVKIASNTQQGLVPMYGRTDAQGRYRLNPYLPAKDYWMQVFPPDGEPYLIVRQIHAWPSGAVRKEVNFALPRGVLVRGKITEQFSGKPVEGAAVVYRAAFGNPNRIPDVVADWTGVTVSRADGTFKVAVYPGKGHLLVNSTTPEFIHTEVGENMINNGRPGGKRLYPDGLVKLDLPRKAKVHDVAVKLRRGVVVSGRLVGPDGKPVEEARVVNPLWVFAASEPEWRNSHEKIRAGRFALYGCDPNKTLKVHFLDARNKNAATVEISPKKEKDKPLTVKLKPCGSAQVRFVDGDGKPLPGLSPLLMIMTAPGPNPSDYQALQQGALAANEDHVANLDRVNYASQMRSDARGRCTFPALIPGATYRVQLILSGQLRVYKEFTVEAGKTARLPDMVVKPAR
jgi:RNA polymerase sigma factor (sigma-70 family)